MMCASRIRALRERERKKRSGRGQAYCCDANRTQLYERRHLLTLPPPHCVCLCVCLCVSKTLHFQFQLTWHFCFNLFVCHLPPGSKSLNLSRSDLGFTLASHFCSKWQIHPLGHSGRTQHIRKNSVATRLELNPAAVGSRCSGLQFLNVISFSGFAVWNLQLANITTSTLAYCVCVFCIYYINIKSVLLRCLWWYSVLCPEEAPSLKFKQ